MLQLCEWQYVLCVIVLYKMNFELL